jgi:phospholipid/cholesterol/gamma-HCH transport system substrate-binding protein
MRRPEPATVARTARELRRQLRSMLLMIAVAVFGLAVGAYLVVHQRIQWPSWVPFLGQHYFVLNARVTAVSGVLPGQGQAVTVSGVTVGEISGVSLRNGLPVVTMRIDPQ